VWTRVPPWFLPGLFLVHVTEELAFGFPAWARAHFGAITTTRFFLISHVPLVAGAVAVGHWGQKGTRAGAFLLVAAFVTLVTNGLFHLATTVLFREYSPGVVSAATLYVPATIYLASRVRRAGLLSPRDATAAIALGCVLSVGVIASLFLDRVPVSCSASEIRSNPCTTRAALAAC
jgi:hypothetical protein